ncbi:ABC transporter ATP-binding protein [Asticcacaulis machinosus]|uniref:Sn-glycerol-3-phosphate ABC transporter ATP-binding protein UgpC n=1 Tax=Asticcacaulis machinosus TaxID=2984211 RepID=A0ABT5HNS1_9CAUL|nr:sn-glycerol-3-phosphate ABC transporter ATP-binding protein UgpC [Asticcacaulis machinosus]
MSALDIRNVTKAYGPTTVLDDISLRAESNEFIAFLGPSGCGKTTLLRMVAGLETVDSGQIHIGGQRIDELAPGERGVAMVFQHYALYPHMTIRENMAFGLKNIKISKTEIDARIAEAARILEIEPFLDKKPGQLSGGQKQRVAIGRAIVKKPDIFLFDEPLSNLDAALRMRTRLELAQLRRRLKATMILVTHDQVEAMTLADRIVVMYGRKIQQVGTPMEIYGQPANRFVASFVGSPPMNFMPVTVTGTPSVVTLRDGTVLTTAIANLPESASWELGLRPENVRVNDTGVSAKVEFVERLGERALIYARLSDGTAITAEDVGLSRLTIGDEVHLSIDAQAAHLFDADGRGYHAEAA